MEARIRITSPQMKGEVKVKVVGKPKLILINGHWNKLLHKLNVSPGGSGRNYWLYFIGNLSVFINDAWKYFGVAEFWSDPHYIDGSSLMAIDQSGAERKQRGYNHTLENLSTITEGVDKRTPVYIISHSEGCAFAAGVAKALIQQGYKVGESVMLSADESDEFSVEGNYPCYQITAGRIISQNRLFQGVQKRFEVDWVVRYHHIEGVTRSGVYIAENVTEFNVHTDPVGRHIFEKLKELKQLVLQQWWDEKGKIFHRLMQGDNTIWHRVNDIIVYNNNIDIEYTKYGLYRRRKLK